MPRVYTLLTAVMLLVAITQAAPAPQERPNQAVLFPTTKGARWVYHHFNRSIVNPAEAVEVVTGVATKGLETVVSVGQEYHDRVVPAFKVAVGERGLFLVECSGRTFDPPVCMVKLPYEPGSKWPVKTPVFEGWGTAQEWEMVKVPAGEYKAVRIDAVLNCDGHVRKDVFWFAPGVGLVKREGEQSSQVLMSFTPGPPDSSAK
jgi:hypothetical protein